MNQETNRTSNHIKVLEVNFTGLATELDDLSALYPCKIKVCAAEVDTHIAFESPEDFISEEEVLIWAILKCGIVPGIYVRKLPNTLEKLVS